MLNIELDSVCIMMLPSMGGRAMAEQVTLRIWSATIVCVVASGRRSTIEFEMLVRSTETDVGGSACVGFGAGCVYLVSWSAEMVKWLDRLWAASSCASAVKLSTLAVASFQVDRGVLVGIEADVAAGCLRLKAKLPLVLLCF